MLGVDRYADAADDQELIQYEYFYIFGLLAVEFGSADHCDGLDSSGASKLQKIHAIIWHIVLRDVRTRSKEVKDRKGRLIFFHYLFDYRPLYIDSDKNKISLVSSRPCRSRRVSK